ncbi:MAG: 3-deoxy-manno-octulosonate cytidylyltransferase [Phycisphaerales bacterium]|jgi:3-deoxy-manno-octulosonate cytidylyltransferase (CMP-KDO synthetase)|nr:3-deoxy-manno-octulosonate cytidylyltransferase [Phycisphaerales bacterium]
MSVVAIIPARLGSTRFPRKVLADRTGHPLIQHVYDAAKLAPSLERVVIATDDDEIVRAARAFGAEAVLTRADHPNGTSRLAEAAALLALAPDDVVVNVQGDEPEIEHGVIDAAVGALRGSDCPVATIASPLAGGDDPDDPSLVKVVLDARSRALYFSRSRIPFVRDASGPDATRARRDACLKHVGLYVYRRSFLDAYVELEPTPLERAESLEQLRVLEHGFGIAVAVRACHHRGIDTPEQYDAFVSRWRARGGADSLP